MKAIKMLTPKQLSQIFEIPDGTLRYWRSVGLGPVWHKLEGSIRYALEDVEAYLQSSRRIPSVHAFMEQRHVSA
jgi:predicted site-specific integrase-resolvase